ncbi:kallikrein-11-like [Thrips palmi]|uniref:Kallikrein-11-like n=1 Tax=Thrips palmi TaxID=161013 RepID=A0A6P8YT59_THRPL|nr:kallikrein-11-like [Thrips palmi]
MLPVEVASPRPRCLWLCLLACVLTGVTSRSVPTPTFDAPYPDEPEVVLKLRDGTDGCKGWRLNATLVVSVGPCIVRANKDHQGVQAVELRNQRVAVANTRWWKEGLAFLWLHEKLKGSGSSISLTLVERALEKLGSSDEEPDVVLNLRDGSSGCKGWVVNATLVLSTGDCIERHNKDHGGVYAVQLQDQRVDVVNTRWWLEGLAFLALREKLKGSSPTSVGVVLRPLVSDCGFASASGQAFIIKGENASVSEFPWHAGLYLDSVQVCGGSLVLPRVVLTAAHCLFKSGKQFDPSDLKVSVGSPFRDLSQTTTGSQQRNVSRLIPHPRFRGFGRNFADDIGLVVLQSPIVFNAYVVPICVDWGGSAVPRPSENSVGKVVGWGRTEDTSPSPVLQSAQLPFIPFEKCAEAVPPTFLPFLTHDKFCAGNVGGSSVAPGDSGGGLAFPHDGRWFLMGVVSVGIPGQLTYSAFTDVHLYSSWLNETLKTI